MVPVVAIDFETANRSPASVCEVGLVRVGSTESWGSLVHPPPGHDRFSSFNIGVHGITPRKVAQSPEWDRIWSSIAPFFSGSVMIAHNASFDMSVLRSILAVYGIRMPEFDFFCTCKSSRRAWSGLDNHRLDTVARSLGFAFCHHDALEDAKAAAVVLKGMLRVTRTEDIRSLAEYLGIALGHFSPGGIEPCRCLPKCRC